MTRFEAVRIEREPESECVASAPLFRRFERNLAGRDYVVGDVHGRFDLLRAALRQISFDGDRDRLFSVGDLIDRGERSGEVAHWLGQPRFHAVRGNHEQMVLDVCAGVWSAEHHVNNGGAWFYRMSETDRARIHRQLSELPLAIEVDTPAGLVGIVHAEVPGDDWAAFRASLLAPVRPANYEHIERFALWGRDIIRRRSAFSGVANVGQVFVGHTVVPDVAHIGNVRYIDTGAFMGRGLTVACLTDGSIVRVAS